MFAKTIKKELQAGIQTVFHIIVGKSATTEKRLMKYFYLLRKAEFGHIFYEITKI